MNLIMTLSLAGGAPPDAATMRNPPAAHRSACVRGDTPCDSLLACQPCIMFLQEGQLNRKLMHHIISWQVAPAVGDALQRPGLCRAADKRELAELVAALICVPQGLALPLMVRMLPAVQPLLARAAEVDLESPKPLGLLKGGGPMSDLDRMWATMRLLQTPSMMEDPLVSCFSFNLAEQVCTFQGC